MCKNSYDVIIIGGGAAGCASALKLAKSGWSVSIVEREPYLGGILLQCIHNGFGLHRFKEELTGPEYSERFSLEVNSLHNVDCYLNTTALNICAENKMKKVTIASSDGCQILSAKAIIMANGCRERNRGNLGIPGGRPSGVMTAGLAQRLLNIEGYVPGSTAVIVGSGDIGLIMARRLTWAGVKVKAVVEILPYPSGLPRNISQCLDDFGIPLYLSHCISSIKGKQRVERVEVMRLKDGGGQPDDTFPIECDTILLSVGLVPETELLRKSGADVNSITSGAIIDSSYMTTLDGVFSCGNALHVHDLVDYVSEEAERCAIAIDKFLQGRLYTQKNFAVNAGNNIRYVVPNKITVNEDTLFSFRPMVPIKDCEINIKIGGQIIKSKKKKIVRPSEMEKIDLKASEWSFLTTKDNAIEIEISKNCLD